MVLGTGGNKSPVPEPTPISLAQVPEKQSATPKIAPNPTQRTEPAPVPAPEPREVGSWTGSGNKKTETFEITSTRYRVHILMSPDTVRGGEVDGAVSVTSYVSGGGELEFEQLGSENSSKETTSDTYGNGPGKFYLEINSANARWKVTVTDGE